MPEAPLRHPFTPVVLIGEPRAPDPVDRHVGGKLATFRKARGLSQSDLGGRLGLSFQQVQKYEAGANRISSSRLWAAASALGVQVGDFFSGLPSAPESTRRTDRTLAALDLETGDLEPEDQQLMLTLARRLTRRPRT